MVTSATEIYTLSLHDALPIFAGVRRGQGSRHARRRRRIHSAAPASAHRRRGRSVARHLCRSENRGHALRSEEHTSELQSRRDLVCRLLLEKKKKKTRSMTNCS